MLERDTRNAAQRVKRRFATALRIGKHIARRAVGSRNLRDRFLDFSSTFPADTSDAFSSLLSSLVARLKAIMAQAGLVSPEPQVFVCGNSFGS
jgi:hypothetical protein